MKILAIESSCDETACAIIEDGRKVLSSVVFSQIDIHKAFGGVVPEVAAREHIKSINPTIEQALDEASLDLDDIDAFASTIGPGLIGSLLVGAGAGKTLSFISEKPFIGVDHLYAHVASNYLETDLEPPFLALLVSGGHTQIIVVENYDTMRIVGETLDDAVGEAYDKVARLMDLPYPGGPNLDKLSKQGNPKAYRLPKASTKNPYDFSFSGLKTATMRAYEVAIAEVGPQASEEALTQIKTDMAASFQHTVANTLFKKVLAYAEAHNIKTLSICGGVSANSGLRQRFQDFVSENPDYKLFIPKMNYCTDNAAMIGACAFFNPLTNNIEDEVYSRQPMIKT